MAAERGGQVKTIVCLPLHATLTRDACGRRHRLANTRGGTLAIKLEHEHLENLRCSPCKDCPVGAANADIGRLPPPKRRKNRDCRRCGTSFEPLTCNATYCSVTCRHVVAKQAERSRAQNEGGNADRSD